MHLVMTASIKKTIIKLINEPLSIPYIIFSVLICKIKSIYYSLKIDSGKGKIIITDPFISLKIIKHKTSNFNLLGNLQIIPHVGGNNRIVISMGANSTLQINGEFTIGQGVRISLSKDSILKIEGKNKESGSGITADTLILVNKKIEIGKDFMCAWNVLISDSDWHEIEGQHHQGDISIGDHVWVANSNSILKGTTIGNNCIVASHSKITNKSFPESVLIGGIPPKILKTNIKWNRDIIKS